MRSSQAGLEVAWASPAILTRLCPIYSSRSFSFSICSAELRVAFWPLLAAWPHAVLAHSSPRPLEGSGRAPRASPGNGARSLAYMQGAWRMAHHMTDKDKQQATSNGGV